MNLYESLKTELKTMNFSKFAKNGQKSGTMKNPQFRMISFEII